MNVFIGRGLMQIKNFYANHMYDSDFTQLWILDLKTLCYYHVNIASYDASVITLPHYCNLEFGNYDVD